MSWIYLIALHFCACCSHHDVSCSLHAAVRSQPLWHSKALDLRNFSNYCFTDESSVHCKVSYGLVLLLFQCLQSLLVPLLHLQSSVLFRVVHQAFAIKTAHLAMHINAISTVTLQTTEPRYARRSNTVYSVLIRNGEIDHRPECRSTDVSNA